MDSLIFFGASGSAFCASTLFAQCWISSLVTVLVFYDCSKFSSYFCHHFLITDTIYKLAFEPSVSFFVTKFVGFASSSTNPFLCISFCSLMNLQYCSDSVVFLCCGLNFPLSTSNSPSLFLHFSSSELLRVCSNLSLSWPNHLIIIGALSLSWMLQLFVKKMFFTLISNCKILGAHPKISSQMWIDLVLDYFFLALLELVL